MGKYKTTVLTASMRKPLYGLLGSQVLLAGLLYGELPWGVLVSVFIAVMICAVCLAKRWPLPSAVFLIPLGFAAILGIWLWFHTLNGAQAGVSLLFLATTLKTLEIRTHRDLIVATIISFLLTASTFLFSQDIAHSLFAMANLVWLVAILGLINGRYLPYQPSFASDLRAATVTIIAAIPLMLLFFIFFPRIDGPLWGSPNHKNQGVTGLSDSLSPGSLSNLVQSHALAFRAHFNGPPPPLEDRYWRAYVLTRFNGMTWLPALNLRKPSTYLEISGTPLRYTLIIPATGQQGLPTLGLPANEPPGTHLVAGYTLRTQQAINHLRAFYLKAAIGPSHLEGVLANRVLHQDLRLPNNYAPKAHALVHLWLRHAHGPDALIAEALKYFHSNPFYYTLTPPRLKGNITDQFLFKSRQGFCEDYASAFAVLMRLAGIPSRIVVGYMGGTWNSALDYFTVNQSDAHAWVEVWIRQQGWVRIDPTAAVSSTRVDPGLESTAYGGIGVQMRPDTWFSRVSNTLRMDWGTVGYLWDSWIIAFGPASQRALLHRLGLQSDYLSLVMYLGIGFVLSILIGTTWTYWRQRPPPPPPELRLYRKYLNYLKHHGLNPNPSEGALELAERVGKKWPHHSHDAIRIALKYYEAHYAPASQDPSINRLESLHQAIQKIRLTK